MSHLPTPSVALAIGAHPDDIEFGCGGTLAKWTAAGCRIVHLVCTDGSKGTWDGATDPTALVLRRHDEQREASRRLGGSGEVVFLDWPDGELEAGPRQRAQVVGVIRRFRPAVVLAHDPWKRYRLHPDHRHAGFLALDAVVSARDPLYFPEIGPAHHRPATVLLFEADEPDHIEDVTTSFDKKIDALLAHESQLASTMRIDGGDEAATARFVAKERERAIAAGSLAGVELGESFKRLDADA